MLDLDTLREEFRREQERHSRRMDELHSELGKIKSVIQGDSAYRQKGVIEKMDEVLAVIAELKDVDFKDLKGTNLKEAILFFTRFNEVKKTVLWLAAGFAAIAIASSAVLNNIDKIQNYLHH